MSNISLYLPEKYKVLTGSKTSKALCTCWFDVLSVVRNFPQIEENFALSGTLYSKEGVSIILRNLALNPFIKTLFVWNQTPLSQTPFGRAGWELLQKVWENPTQNQELHHEIELETIQKIISNVDLVFLASPNFSESLLEAVSYQTSELSLYMPKISFPEPKRNQDAPFPSEKVGFSVRSKNIYGAYIEGLDRILRYGHIKKTEYGSAQRELINLNWVIEKETLPEIFIPPINQEVLNQIGFSQESLDKYQESLLDPAIPEGTSYTYGSRLRKYGIFSLDQVEMIINKLKETPYSRRAFATTINPEIDVQNSSPPCLSFIEFLSDDYGNLHLLAVFRSHDLFKAGIPNAYGLLHLHDYVCQQTGLNRGSLSINSMSAHVYEEDWKTAFDLIKCQKWERSGFRFNEHEEVDPRGIVVILVDQGNIILELKNLNGDTLFKFVSESARESIMKISKLNLLSRADHYADICIELVKAEIAIQTSQNYQQDKLLTFGDAKLL